MKMECMHCSKEFSAIRPTAKFCSNSCKTKANVQRRQDEITRAENEAQHLLEQEQLRQQTEERRIKREQRAELKKQAQAVQAEIERQAKEAKRIKDEQDAVALAEKSRKDAEDRQALRDKQEADEKQRLADKEAKRIIERDRKAKEDLAAYNRKKAWVDLTLHVIGNISNLLSDTKDIHPKPDSTIKPFEKLSLGNAFPQNSKPIAWFVPRPKEMPNLSYMSLPGINWMQKGNTAQ